MICYERRSSLMKLINKIFSVLLALVLLTSLCALSIADSAPVNVYALKGPTGIGLVHLMENGQQNYSFTLCGSPDEAVAALVSGSADIAAVSANLASVLYNKTKGKIRMLGLNTLGVLSILERGDTIHSVQDLAGKEIQATGQAAIPEYALNYILKANGLQDSVTVSYSSEHAELATLATAGQADLIMLPEPYVTSILTQCPDFRIALDVTEAFEEAAALQGSQAVLSMGAIVARADFVEAHPDVIEAFLEEYALSVSAVNEQPAEAGALAEKHGVMPKAAVVEKAVPNCHMVLITGREMKDRIMPFFEILFEASPSAVGGALPGDDLFYGVEN